MINFEPISINDLQNLSALQPPAWPDIKVEFKYYIENDFCHPIKAMINHKIVAIGTAIHYLDTAWLAHIIVHPDFRKKGIGAQITKALVDQVKNSNIETILLIATKQGKSVYERVGFKVVTDYIYLQSSEKNTAPFDAIIDDKVVPLQIDRKNELLALDQKVTGEDRKEVLMHHLEHALVYLENDQIKGYCIPDFRDGPICATSPEAGLALMKIKYTTINQAAIPQENTIGLDYLKSIGFEKMDIKGTRMMIGKAPDWRPANIYSRMGGNFG